MNTVQKFVLLLRNELTLRLLNDAAPFPFDSVIDKLLGADYKASMRNETHETAIVLAGQIPTNVGSKPQAPELHRDVEYYQTYLRDIAPTVTFYSNYADQLKLWEGIALASIKNQLPYGQWGKWLEDNNWKRSTADLRIAIADKWVDADRALEDFDYTEECCDLYPSFANAKEDADKPPRKPNNPKPECDQSMTYQQVKSALTRIRNSAQKINTNQWEPSAWSETTAKTEFYNMIEIAKDAAHFLSLIMPGLIDKYQHLIDLESEEIQPAASTALRIAEDIDDQYQSLPDPDQRERELAGVGV